MTPRDVAIQRLHEESCGVFDLNGISKELLALEHGDISQVYADFDNLTDADDIPALMSKTYKANKATPKFAESDSTMDIVCVKVESSIPPSYYNGRRLTKQTRGIVTAIKPGVADLPKCVLHYTKDGFKLA